MKIAACALGTMWACGALLACNAIVSVPEPVVTPPSARDAGGPDAVAIADAAVDTIPDAGDTCDGGAVTLASDPLNCGSCGHDCLGGECANGACEPILLASHAAGAVGIAVDDVNVYFTQYNAGCVSKVPKSGGTVSLMSAGYGNPWMVVSDGTNVYWSDRKGTISYAATTSGVPAPDGGSMAQCGVPAADGGVVVGDVRTLVALTAADDPYGIATDGANIFWTNLGNGGGVWGTPIAGLHPSAPQLIVPGSCEAYCETGIAMLGSTLFWLAYAGSVYATSLAAEPSATAQLTRLGNVDSRFVATDGTNVYWTMSDGSSVWTVPVAGGETVEISGVESTPWGITADSSGVYWVNSFNVGPGGSALRRARFENGSWSIVNLAGDLGLPFGVVTDSTAIYWVENGTGLVMKLAK
jgi:hypothetical protein